MFSVSWWQRRLYPCPEAVDPVRRFLQTVDSSLRPDSTVLDIGAGAGQINGHDFRGRVKRMTGVDLDPRVANNPLLDEGLVGSAYEIPCDDATFDVAFSIYVLEHIDDPARFLREVFRVLKPGGKFLCLTPNRWHYVPLVASLTPFQFHQWYNRRRGRDEEDTFPTLYRMNTRAALRRQGGAAGFERSDMTMIEVMPNYLKFSVPTFLAGALYERAVNSTRLLADLRVNVIGCFQKPGSDRIAERRAA